MIPRQTPQVPEKDQYIGRRHGYAQTITQLFNQLISKGVPLADILVIRNAYKEVMALFSCRFQPSGKTYISHVVGTASILASLDADPKLVAAGLLHNVYENGDFGCSLKILSPRKRGHISKAVGQEVEEYVGGFREMRWNPSTIPGIHENLDRFDSAKRGAVLIRLADWLEHHLDLGACYCPPSILRDTINKSCGDLMAGMANALGHPDLGWRILNFVEENARTGRTLESQDQRVSTRSEVIIPGSFHKRLSVVVCENVRSGRSYIRSLRTPRRQKNVPPQRPVQKWPSPCRGLECSSAIRHTYAQTSLQLFNQLRASGYTQEDLHCVHQAYDLAVSIFSGIYRPSWKSAISHFIGVASILATFGAPPRAVAAGVLHNAYKNGDFGTGRKGISQKKRVYVRTKMGCHIEEYLARFAQLKWTGDSLLGIVNNLPTFDDIDRSVVLIRLADHLERFLDHDILYSGEQEKQKYFDRTSPVVEIGNALGHCALVSEIEKFFTETKQIEIPLELQTGRNDSHFLKPKSYSLRFGVFVRKRVRQGRRGSDIIYQHRFTC